MKKFAQWFEARTTEDEEDKGHYGQGEKVTFDSLLDRVTKTIKLAGTQSDRLDLINQVLGTKYKPDDVMF